MVTDRPQGTCRHGKFYLEDGCPQCIAENTGKRVNTEPHGVIPQTATIIVSPSRDEAVIKLYHEAITLQEYSESRTIQSLDDLKAATADLNIIRSLKRTIESLRKDWLKPLQEHTKSINEQFAEVQKPVLAADKATVDKILEFNREQVRIRAKQQKINDLRIKAAEEEAALNNGEITESVDLIKPVPEVPEYVRTDAGNAGMRDNWKWEVTDFAQIPDEYKKIDEGTLTRVVKAGKGKVPIPGVRIYNEPIIAVRK